MRLSPPPSSAGAQFSGGRGFNTKPKSPCGKGRGSVDVSCPTTPTPTQSPRAQHNGRHRAGAEPTALNEHTRGTQEGQLLRLSCLCPGARFHRTGLFFSHCTVPSPLSALLPGSPSRLLLVSRTQRRQSPPELPDINFHLKT